MFYFSECSTVAANCNTEIEIEMRDRTVEHFPGRDLCEGRLAEVANARGREQERVDHYVT